MRTATAANVMAGLVRPSRLTYPFHLQEERREWPAQGPVITPSRRVLINPFRTRGSLNVHFAPGATKSLHRREMSRCAEKRPYETRVW